LAYKAHIGSKELDIERSDVVSVEEDVTFHWIVESLEELEDSRLARPRRTNDSGELPFRNVHVDILQNGN
jgi:hypothetical protein